MDVYLRQACRTLIRCLQTSMSSDSEDSRPGTPNTSGRCTLESQNNSQMDEEIPDTVFVDPGQSSSGKVVSAQQMQIDDTEDDEPEVPTNHGPQEMEEMDEDEIPQATGRGKGAMTQGIMVSLAEHRVPDSSSDSDEPVHKRKAKNVVAGLVVKGSLLSALSYAEGPIESVDGVEPKKPLLTVAYYKSVVTPLVAAGVPNTARTVIALQELPSVTDYAGAMYDKRMGIEGTSQQVLRLKKELQKPKSGGYMNEPSKSCARVMLALSGRLVQQITDSKAKSWSDAMEKVITPMLHDVFLHGIAEGDKDDEHELFGNRCFGREWQTLLGGLKDMFLEPINGRYNCFTPAGDLTIFQLAMPMAIVYMIAGHIQKEILDLRATLAQILEHVTDSVFRDLVICAVVIQNGTAARRRHQSRTKLFANRYEQLTQEDRDNLSRDECVSQMLGERMVRVVVPKTPEELKAIKDNADEKRKQTIADKRASMTDEAWDDLIQTRKDKRKETKQANKDAKTPDELKKIKDKGDEKRKKTIELAAANLTEEQKAAKRTARKDKTAATIAAKKLVSDAGLLMNMQSTADEALKAKDDQVEATLKLKDDQVAAALKAKDDELEAKEAELAATKKLMEDMTAALAASQAANVLTTLGGNMQTVEREVRRSKRSVEEDGVDASMQGGANKGGKKGKRK